MFEIFHTFLQQFNSTSCEKSEWLSFIIHIETVEYSYAPAYIPIEGNKFCATLTLQQSVAKMYETIQTIWNKKKKEKKKKNDLAIRTQRSRPI